MKFRNFSGVIPFFVSLALIPFALLWLHHHLPLGNNPWLLLVFLAVAVFMGVTLYRWLGTQSLGESPYETVFLFAGAVLNCLVYWKLVSRAAFAFNWQGADYLFSSTGVLLTVLSFYFVMGAIYYLIAKRNTIQPDKNLAAIHFWVSFICISFFLWNHLAANALHPIDLKNPGVQTVTHRFQFVNPNDLVLGVSFLLAQMLFVFNLIRAAAKS
jgi:hypothetical protein